jgi:hypothetical protein
VASHWREYIAVVVSAILFLIVDNYLQVKSLKALLRATSFYLLAIIFVVLNIISYGGMSLAFGSKFDKVLGSAAFLAVVVVSTLGTVGFLQSLSLKAAGHKFIDAEKIIEAYKARVLDEATKKFAESENQKASDLADKVQEAYAGNYAILRTDYFQVMKTSGRKEADIEKDLQEIKERADRMGLNFERLLIEAITAKAPLRAESIVKHISLITNKDS